MQLAVLCSTLILLGICLIPKGRERLITLICGAVQYSPLDFHTLERSPRPQHYLLCPPQECSAQADAPSPSYPVSVENLRDRWLELMARQPRLETLASDPQTLQYDFVQRSRFWRFPDTITVRFLPLDASHSTLAIYSRSHYGYSDLGVNRRRVTTWLAALR